MERFPLRKTEVEAIDAVTKAHQALVEVKAAFSARIDQFPADIEVAKNQTRKEIQDDLQAAQDKLEAVQARLAQLDEKSEQEYLALDTQQKEAENRLAEAKRQLNET